MDPLYGLKNPFMLAPMHNLNHASFRLLCKENGAQIVFSQMYDSNTLCGMGKAEGEKLINIQPDERPIVIQIIGRDQKKIRAAMGLLEDIADGFNLNAGCIEKEYLERGCGAALMRDTVRLYEIVRSMRHGTKKQLSVKIRAGWDDQSLNAVEVTKNVAVAGADMVIIHGRTGAQRYAGKSNWTIMRQAKERSPVPVIANGDVRSYEAGLELMKKTLCDGVMIGREAKYKPWVFRKEEISQEEIKRQLLRFLELCKKIDKGLPLPDVQDILFRMTRDYRTDKDKWDIKKKCRTFQETVRFIEEM